MLLNESDVGLIYPIVRFIGYETPPVKKSDLVSVLCSELGITRQTLYRHVDPKGNLRPDGKKLLDGKKSSTKTG